MGVYHLLLCLPSLAQRRLDPARPLWELWLLPGPPERRVGALFKVHQIMVAAFGVLLDLAPDAPTPVAPAWTPAIPDLR
jgi:hypothetical protein